MKHHKAKKALKERRRRHDVAVAADKIGKGRGLKRPGSLNRKRGK